MATARGLPHAKDAGPKRRAYARGGIPASWIVDLNRRLVEVHALGSESHIAAAELFP